MLRSTPEPSTTPVTKVRTGWKVVVGGVLWVDLSALLWWSQEAEDKCCGGRGVVVVASS